MKINSVHRSFLALALLQCSLWASACTPQTGEIVVVVQSDMEMPKDIDTLRIEVSQAGFTTIAENNQQLAHLSEHEHLGEPGLQKIQLPATIGILAPEENPNSPVTVRVVGKRGGANGRQRILNEIVTTVPADRIVTMPLPVQFLCADRIGKQNDCMPGTRCVAGECVPNTIDSTALPDYSEPEVFGEGECVSVAVCMENAVLHQAFADMNDEGKCKVNLGHPIADSSPSNIAVLTDYKGMCNSTGCYVALDADNEAGWKILDADQGIIQVAQGICNNELSNIVRGVAEAPVTNQCPQKALNVPTCGPWSTAGLGDLPSGSFPLSRASGQHRPTSIAVAKVSYPGSEFTEEFIFWGSAGLFAQGSGGPVQTAPGTVHSARIEPSEDASMSAELNDTVLDPSLLHEESQLSSRDITFAENRLYWTLAAGDQSKPGQIQWVELNESGGTTWDSVSLNTMAPEGIAAEGKTLMWTDFTTGSITKATIGTNGKPDLANASSLDQKATSHPYRIAILNNVACWTNEGTPMLQAGALMCSHVDLANPANDWSEIFTTQDTPRAIAMAAGQGSIAEVYFATFEKEGAIYRSRISTDPMNSQKFVGETVELAIGQAYPNGIALDDKYVYWTNWGDGTVHRLSRGATTSSMPEVLATGQRSPSEIAVLKRSDQEVLVFWLNEGSPLDLSVNDPEGKNKVADGMVMQLVLGAP